MRETGRQRAGKRLEVGDGGEEGLVWGRRLTVGPRADF